MGKKSKAARDETPSPPPFRRDMMVFEALERHPKAGDVLLEFGLPCHRCIVAEHETLEQGCVPLGLRVDEVVARLNALPAT